jgi:hypothetical protein
LDSPFSLFTPFDVLEILRDAGLPEALTDENVARVGLRRTRPNTQRETVLSLYARLGSVDAIFEELGGEVPKSSIRAILSRATDAGLIARDWATRRRRPRFRRVRP